MKLLRYLLDPADGTPEYVGGRFNIPLLPEYEKDVLLRVRRLCWESGINHASSVSMPRLPSVSQLAFQQGLQSLVQAVHANVGHIPVSRPC